MKRPGFQRTVFSGVPVRAEKPEVAVLAESDGRSLCWGAMPEVVLQQCGPGGGRAGEAGLLAADERQEVR